MCDQAKILAEATRSCLCAPAGCGKTHLVAETVAKYSKGRELILTHTHAGVDALRRQLRRHHASSGSYHIDTIAGWALRYASSFPRTASFAAASRPSREDWDNVYQAAARLLRTRHVRDIARLPYTGVFVDEYQDCTIHQHELIVALADIMPCRVLGDPLQGIFDFGKNIIVDWRKHVLQQFEPLPQLNYPWRWETARQLGEWLMDMRARFEQGCPIDLSHAPKAFVTWRFLPDDSNQRSQAQRAACDHVCHDMPKEQTAVAILDWPQQCHKLVRSLGPAYSIIEPVECADLSKSCREIADSSGIGRVDVLLEFAAECLTGVKAELKTVIGAVGSGTKGMKCKHQDQLRALRQVASENSLSPVAAALESIQRIQGVHFVRRELFYEMCRSVRAYLNGGYESLEDAAWHVRNRTRRIGRVIGRKIISRTLLVKGLQFDHALVLDADRLDSRHLYVAMTRGALSLTILSKRRVLQPKPPRLH